MEKKGKSGDYLVSYCETEAAEIQERMRGGVKGGMERDREKDREREAGFHVSPSVFNLHEPN